MRYFVLLILLGFNTCYAQNCHKLDSFFVSFYIGSSKAINGKNVYVKTDDQIFCSGKSFGYPNLKKVKKITYFEKHEDAWFIMVEACEVRKTLDTLTLNFTVIFDHTEKESKNIIVTQASEFCVKFAKGVYYIYLKGSEDIPIALVNSE